MNKISIAIAVFLTATFYTTGCDKVVKTETVASEKNGKMAEAVVVATDSAASKTSHFLKKLFAHKKIKAADVSKASKTSVQQLYPEMEVVEWESAPEYIVESRNDTMEAFEVIHPEVYIVTLKKDNELTKAKFNKEGQFIEAHKTLAQEHVPLAIEESLRKGIYKDWKIISEKEEIKHVAEKEILYRIVVEKDKQKQVLYFRKNGTLAKTLNPI